MHGTENGYRNHGCRCAPCTEAWRIAYGTKQRQRATTLGPCSVQGCDGYQYAKGYCRTHYERQRTGRPLRTVLHRRHRPTDY